MHCKLVYIELLLALIASLTQANSNYDRDQNSDNSGTTYNLPSTLANDVRSYHQQNRPQLQLPNPTLQRDSGGNNSPRDIDDPFAHETGGRPQVGSPDNSYDGTRQLNHIYPSVQAQPVNPYPSYQYPGRYLPRYPVYPQGAPIPGYPNFEPGNIPVIMHPGAPQVLPIPGYPNYEPGNTPLVMHPVPPPISYQNQIHYPPHNVPANADQPNYRFTANNEYPRDGGHAGPYDIVNNHNRQGYGSGFGGDYNGVFNRPQY